MSDDAANLTIIAIERASAFASAAADLLASAPDTRELAIALRKPMPDETPPMTEAWATLADALDAMAATAEAHAAAVAATAAAWDAVATASL